MQKLKTSKSSAVIQERISKIKQAQNKLKQELEKIIKSIELKRQKKDQ